MSTNPATIKQSLLPLNRKGDRRGMHPNARAAIQPPPNPIKPGETRNLTGYSITLRARQKLKEVCPFDAKGRTWAEVLPEDILRQAHLKTDGMRELLDRLEGKVPDKHLVLGEVNVRFVIGKGYKEQQVSIPLERKELIEGNGNS